MKSEISYQELRLIIRQEVLKLLDDYYVQKKLLNSLFGSRRPICREEAIVLIKEQIDKDKWSNTTQHPNPIHHELTDPSNEIGTNSHSLNVESNKKPTTKEELQIDQLKERAFARYDMIQMAKL